MNLPEISTAYNRLSILGRGAFALRSVLAERIRQEERWGQQNHSPEKWLAILMEEVGEFAKEVLEGDRALARGELVQVAAVTLAMLESLDRQDAQA